LFVNDRTLFNIIVPDLSRAEIRKLSEQFTLTLSCVLASEGFPKHVVEKVMSEYEQIEFAKSANRSVLGSVNDLAFHYKHLILGAGGVHSWRVPDIIWKLNRM